MPDDYFGDEVAATYDEAMADMSADSVVAPTVGLLADLADGGRALEFGVGTGRIALPLARPRRLHLLRRPSTGVDGLTREVAAVSRSGR